MGGKIVKVIGLFLLLILWLLDESEAKLPERGSHRAVRPKAGPSRNIHHRGQPPAQPNIKPSKTQGTPDIKPAAQSEEAVKQKVDVAQETVEKSVKKEEAAKVVKDPVESPPVEVAAKPAVQKRADSDDVIPDSGQSKDGRISPEIPGASIVPNSPPSLQIPINLAPSQATGQDEDKTSSATPNLESSRTSTVSPESASASPGSGSGIENDGRPVSPPGGGTPNQPEEPAPSKIVRKEDTPVETKDQQVKPDESGRPPVQVEEPVQIPEVKVSEAVPEKPEEVPKVPEPVTENAEEASKTSEGDAKTDEVVAKPVDEVKETEKPLPVDSESETLQKKDATEADALKTAETAEAATETSEPVAKTDEDKAKSAETEEPIVADPHEDIPSFGEWKKKALEEEEQKQTNGKFVHLSEPNALTKRPSTMRTNYASLSCGAKVLGHNAEVQHAEYVLSDNKDQYMINPCKVEKKWFVVELCEPIQVKFIDIANFELFSSLPENFKVFTSDRYPSKDWKYLGIFYAKGERKIQSFPIYGQELYSKYVRIEMISHYGTEHFCPISLLRIFGKSYADIDDDDGHEGSHDDIESDGKKEEHGSGNLFTSATDLVLNVVKKVLNVNENQDAGNATAETIDPSNNTTQTTDQQPTEPGCHDDKNGEKDPDSASAQSDSAHRSSPAPSPTSATPPSVLLTSLVRNRCQACTISQSNYRTYRPIIGPWRCVYMYTMLTSAHAHGHARECSCKRCRKDRLVENGKQTPVITPPVVGSTKQAVAIETTHPSVETDIGVPMATETKDAKIKPTAASVEATKENLGATQQPVVVASEASQPEVVKEDVVKQTDVAMETTKTVAVGHTNTEDSKETEQIKTKIHDMPIDPVGESIGINIIDSNNGAGAKNMENAEDVQNVDTKVSDNANEVQSEDNVKAAETNSANSNNGNSKQNGVNTNTVNQNGGEKSNDDSKNNINIINQAKDNQNAVNQQANQQQALDSVATEDIPAFENPDLKIPDPTKMADPDSWLDFPDQTELPVGGPASAGKRESAIMRINNRLKKLELNMSLSSRYLEELSQTYRKQMDSMYRSFNKTIARLTNTSRLAAISEQRQQENIQALRKQLGELGNTVAAMQNTIDSMHIRYLETHLFWIVVELFIMIAIVVTCTRRGASRQQVQAMIDGIGLPERPRTRTLSTRRLSDSYLHGSPHKSLLKRTGSDSNLNIIEPNVPFLLDEKAPSEIPKEKKRRKPKKSRRSIGSHPPNSAEPTAHAQTNGYHGYNGHVTRSLSLENVAAIMADDVMYPSTSTTSSSGHHNGMTSSRDRRHYDKPVEFIGPLDFYERRLDKGKKKKKRDNVIENGHQKFYEDGAKRKNRTSPLVGQPSNWAKPFSQSQPFYLVQNGNFGFVPSPRHSPRGSPKNSRRNSPEIMMAKSYEHRPFYRMNDTNSEIVRFPQQKFSPDSFSDSGRPPAHAQYGKRGKFPAKKSRAKSSSMDQMER